LNRKKLARTSQQPGKTQTLNFYLLNKQLYLVDLPGYGYAKISKEMREAWGVMIQNYLTGSEMLRYVFQLIDIRHNPTKDDKSMYEWLTFLGFEPIIIATKSDKIKPAQIAAHVDAIKKGLGAERDTLVVPFSSANKQGLDTVLDLLDQVLENEE
jgi:GTP-binding protein